MESYSAAHLLKWLDPQSRTILCLNFSKTCPDDQIAVGLQWDEQGGYGLVDLNMACGNGLNFDFTNNRNGNQNSKQACSSGFKAIQGREQGGYGIVNTNMQCSDSSNWRASNGNMNGGWNGALYCPSGWVITGMEVQEQSGYGIINFRARCTELRGMCLIHKFTFNSEELNVNSDQRPIDLPVVLKIDNIGHFHNWTYFTILKHWHSKIYIF